ncbi:DUF1127 domain-containing protein [Jhaorihella thermophila]|uniref:DUF1127 domain-containing protein n=1 Tax=Jhaorihella thermophila TaxID=488547 RepID=A0A1H5TWY3_9RHOB|nr:DUF1127 domain-containing protein [Jhaorihella thermophila]SEF67344.1 protein of unknown function [Jhaorihella thermophila]
MADITYSAPASAGIREKIATFFDGVIEGLARMAEMNSRVRQMNALMNLSDEQLAARGLRREDIARHVFSDSLYL